MDEVVNGFFCLSLFPTLVPAIATFSLEAYLVSTFTGLLSTTPKVFLIEAV